MFIVRLVDVVVAIELGKLSLDLGHHLYRLFHLVVASLVFGDTGLQGGNIRLRLGGRNSHLLMYRVARHRRRRIVERGLAPGSDLLSLLVFEVLDQPTRTDHIRMFFGKPLQHGVEVALHGVQPTIDFGHRYARNRLLAGIRQEDRLLTQDLAFERIARLLRLAQCELALLKDRAGFAHPAEMILSLGTLRCQIAQLEFLEPRFGLFEFLLIGGDLFVYELSGGCRILARVAKV